MVKIENQIVPEVPRLDSIRAERCTPDAFGLDNRSPKGSSPRNLSKSLWEIVEQSAFLEERMGADFIADERGEDPELIAHRMATWRKNCARGDEKVFLKRLEWDGLSVDQARRLAGRARRGNPELPSWAESLRRMVEESSLAGGDAFLKTDLAAIRGKKTIAFEEFHYPFLQLAREMVWKRAGAAYFLLAEAAHRQWERSLLSALEDIAAETLGHEFTEFRAARVASGAATIPGIEPLPGPESRQLYESFLHSLRGDGLVRLFLAYPVMARYLATRLSFWVDTAVEFLRRLEADQTKLAAQFNQGDPLGQVTKLGSSLSDPHHAGRTALRVHFASGARVIYKPKPVTSEVAYWNLLEWINRNAGLAELRTLQVLDGVAYGWVEEIEPGPCRSQREVEAFYHRAGMLLCLVYVLEGNDCHCENLIAAGEHPVLIDHETFFQPHVRCQRPPGEEGAALLAIRSFYDDSVLRTLLIPSVEIRPSGECFDVSGLGGSEVQLTHRRARVWENINTDAMKLGSEPVSVRPTDNVVIWNGERVQAASYVDQIGAGFEQLYRFLQLRNAGLLAPDGPLHNWGMLRFVFRSTGIYGSMLKRLDAPRFLRHGMDASIELERLSRPLLHTTDRPANWPILADERRSLLQGDVPLFSYEAEKADLFLGSGGAIPQYFQASGLSRVEKRFNDLNDEDLERQLGYLHATFELNRGEPNMESTAALKDFAVSEQAIANREEFLAEAVRIAQLTRGAARHFQDGVSWNTAAYYSAADRWKWEPMTLRFFDGLGGAALFLAAVHKTTGDPEMAALARTALTTIAREASRPDAALGLLEMGIGAGVGPASIVYTLVRASTLLGEEEWLHHAQVVAGIIGVEQINSDRHFDLMAGTAGAVVSLLALYHATLLPEILEKAVLCGQHLLQHRTESRQGLRAWKNCGEEMLTGFSHGAAGIACALLKLYEATGEDSFREAALEAQAYETSVFNPQVCNWPDYRKPLPEGGYGCWTSWCHGGTGIAMSRLATLSILDTPQVQQDIFHGLEATWKAGVESWDTACCGTIGRVEAFVVAAQKLGNLDYLREARTMASTVLRRAQPSGKYLLGWKKVPFLAGFHQGMSGIGYEFLRLANPELPSLLLWE
jgi:type 2 lantibiotic biosynthesis protein LanM